MTIFDLHAGVLSDYRDFVRSFILIADERAGEFVNQALAEKGHLWPEPLMQLSPAYAPGLTVEELAREGLAAQKGSVPLLLQNGHCIGAIAIESECKVLTGECIVVWDMSFGKGRYFRDVTFTE